MKNRRILSLLLLLCMTIGMLGCAKKDDAGLHIVSFNIRAHNDADGNSIKERAPRLHSLIEPIEPDIIGFQEFSPMWEKPIDEYFGEKYEMFLKYRNEAVDLEACPILWRKDKFECVDTGYFWLSDTPEEPSFGWDALYNCFRMCEYVILKDLDTDKQFVVMNTHLGFGDEEQIKSVELIHEYSKKISEYPTIILGDFNMIPSSAGYKRMSELFTDVNAATAKDMSQTYHGYKPEEHKEEHIDYCFISEGIKPMNQEIINDLVDGKYASDHYGLSIILYLEE